MKTMFDNILRGAGYLFDISGSHSVRFTDKYKVCSDAGLRSDVAHLHSDAKRLNGDMRNSFEKIRKSHELTQE